jgi:hypothetical protein
MDALIIVCLSSGNHYEWLREGARRPAWWQQPALRAPFLCEEAQRAARLLQSHATPGKAYRCPRGKASGKGG